MNCMFSLPLTIFLELQRFGILFAVFAGLVVDPLTARALELDEIFLGHRLRSHSNYV